MPDATARQQRILAAVQAQGFATIEALADTLGVSAQTARREAIRLQEAGLLQRFHGGVGLPEERVRPGYALKRHAAPEAKRRIGAAVAALVPRGASVFIDVGTTAEAAARALADHGRLRVVTVSLHVAGLLAGRPGIEVFVAGGTLRGADGSLVGVETCAALARFRCDIALIGCSGFAEDGAVMDHDLDKIAAKQAMLRAARNAVLLADAAKFARTAPALVAPAAAFGRLVTDAAPPAGLAAALAAQGTMTVLA
jgi:DeoR family glycerol-3-phosphate regulon repressor